MAIEFSASAIARMKRYIAFDDDPAVTEAEVTAVMEDYALADSNDVLPSAESWVETLDVYGAAMELWTIKAGRAAKYVSHNADGQQFSMSHLKDHCDEQAARYALLRQVGNITVTST